MLLALCGSLRKDSSHRRLLLSTGLPDVVLYEGLGSLPHFNPDLDEEGMPPPPTVAELRALVSAARGVLISSPEYAHGIPGSLKNGLDWLVSWPDFAGKKVALLRVSTARGEHAHSQLTEILKTMSADLVDLSAFKSTAEGAGDAE
jgi:chromate reductase